MTVGLATTGFVVSLLCALVMGFAIQRGATCTVAAVSQLVDEGKWARFAGLMEAAVWVAGGLLLARACGFLPDLPLGHAVSMSTVIGGILLGSGAYVNKSCVFGTIARIGSRDWAYLATPLGFLGGAWAVSLLREQELQQTAAVVSPLVATPAFALSVFLVFAIWRVVRTATSRSSSLADRIWAPHEATIVIGLAFVVMFVVAGAWAYTDLLVEVAIGMPGDVLVRLLLLFGLLGGSMLSGATGSVVSALSISPGAIVRTFSGGAAMGAGSVLIPGSNDGLILVGMPLLYAYAWIGIGTMCLTIAVAIYFQRLFARQ
jgi:toxin CptA